MSGVFVSEVLVSLTSARAAGKRDECRRAALGSGVWEGLPAELETGAEVEAVAVGRLSDPWVRYYSGESLA